MIYEFTIKKVDLCDEDIELAIDFMQKLSEYQKIEDVSMINKENMIKFLGNDSCEAVFGCIDNKPISFMYYYFNYPILVGEKCIYIDSLYIDENYRKDGIGHKMINYIANKAVEEGYRRLEWTCLNWNEPALNFYKKIGANRADNISLHRVPYDVIVELANKSMV